MADIFIKDNQYWIRSYVGTNIYVQAWAKKFWEYEVLGFKPLNIYLAKNGHSCCATRFWDINLAITFLSFLGLSAYFSKLIISTFLKSTG
jgi:hypothetical protein